MALGWVALLAKPRTGVCDGGGSPKDQLDAAIAGLGPCVPSVVSPLSREARTALEVAASTETSAFVAELLTVAARAPQQQNVKEEELWRAIERNAECLPPIQGLILPLGEWSVPEPASEGTPEQMEYAASLAFSTTLVKLVEAVPSFRSPGLRLRAAAMIQRLPQLASATMHLPSLAAALSALLEHKQTQAVGCCIWLRILPEAGQAAAEVGVPLYLAETAAAAPRGSGTRVAAMEALQIALVSAGEVLRYEDFAEDFSRKLLLASDCDLRLTAATMFFDFLADDQNKDWLLKFARDPVLTKLLCDRFLSPSANPEEVLAVFHLFKIICHNPRKPPEILKILQQRRFDLLLRLGALGWLLGGVEDPELSSDRATVMAALKAL